jgi:hypothetical protein
VPDFKAHSFQLAAQLMIPETQHLDALFSEKLVSLFIFGPLIAKTVAAAVEFDSQLRQRAVEIEEVDGARVLTAESELGETTVAEKVPETLFSIGGFLAEMASEVAGGVCRDGHVAPSPQPPIGANLIFLPKDSE